MEEFSKGQSPPFKTAFFPPLLPTLLVLVLFLKLRNCELRFLKRNRFIYSIKVAKELELRFLRCQNRLSTKLEGGGKKEG